jgi:hypothetical protein
MQTLLLTEILLSFKSPWKCLLGKNKRTLETIGPLPIIYEVLLAYFFYRKCTIVATNATWNRLWQRADGWNQYPTELRLLLTVDTLDRMDLRDVDPLRRGLDAVVGRTGSDFRYFRATIRWESGYGMRLSKTIFIWENQFGSNKYVSLGVWNKRKKWIHDRQLLKKNYLQLITSFISYDSVFYRFGQAKSTIACSI